MLLKKLLECNIPNGGWSGPLDNEDPQFQMEKLAKPRSNMERLIYEAEIISQDESNGVQLWNSKSEYGKTKIIRWKPTMDYA